MKTTISAATITATVAIALATPVASAQSIAADIAASSAEKASSAAQGWVQSIPPAAETLSSDLSERCTPPPAGLGLDPKNQIAGSSKAIGAFNKVFRPCREYELAHYTIRQLAVVLGAAAAAGLAIAWVMPNSPLQRAVDDVARHIPIRP